VTKGGLGRVSFCERGRGEGRRVQGKEARTWIREAHERRLMEGLRKEGGCRGGGGGKGVPWGGERTVVIEGGCLGDGPG